MKRQNIIASILFILAMTIMAFCFASEPFNLSSQDLGFKGPWQSGLNYSDQYGVILNNKYVQRLGHNNAVGLEVDLGTKEYRLNATWAYALNIQQRIKLTLERLAQKMDFDFASGTTHNWIGQNAIGAAYQYLLPQSILSAITVSGYYAKADSKNLSTKSFYQDGILYDNLRHIAGASSENMALGFSSHPWRSGKVDVNIDYDKVHYNTHYEKADNESGLGGSIGLEQLLNQRLKLQLLASKRKPYDEYDAGIFWLPHVHPGSRLEVGFNYAHLKNHTSIPNENRYGIEFTYNWGGKSNSPVLYQLEQQSMPDLASWTSNPAVYMPTVLAMRDQAIRRHDKSGIKSAADDWPTSDPIPPQHLYGDGKDDYRLDVKTLGNFQPDGLRFIIVNAGAPPIKNLHFDSSHPGVLVIPKDVTGEFDTVAVAGGNNAGNTGQPFDITITKANDPKVKPIPSQWFAASNTTFPVKDYFDYNGTVNDKNYLKFSLVNPPAGFSIDAKSGVITMNKTDYSDSPYSLTVKAEKYVDGNDTKINVTGSFQVYIKPQASTEAKTYAHPKNEAISVDAKTDGQFKANGAPVLSYSLGKDAPSWASINSSTGAISVPENKSDYGDYNFEVEAKKAPEKMDAETVSWPLTLKITPLEPKPIPSQWTDPDNVGIDIASYFYDTNRKLEYSISGVGVRGLVIDGGRIIGILRDANTTPSYSATITGKIASGEEKSAVLRIYTLPKAKQALTRVEDINSAIAPIDAAGIGFTNIGDRSWWSYKLEGNVPSGININNSTGEITGTPTASGEYAFSVVGTKSPGDGLTPEKAIWTVTLKVVVQATISCPNEPNQNINYVPWPQTDSINKVHEFILANEKQTLPEERPFYAAELSDDGDSVTLTCKYRFPFQPDNKYMIKTTLTAYDENHQPVKNSDDSVTFYEY